MGLSRWASHDGPLTMGLLTHSESETSHPPHTGSTPSESFVAYTLLASCPKQQALRGLLAYPGCAGNSRQICWEDTSFEHRGLACSFPITNPPGEPSRMKLVL